MTLPSLGGTAAFLPPCARLAAICAAIDGRDVTCPAAMQRTCATLATLRRITRPEQEPSAT